MRRNLRATLAVALVLGCATLGDAELRKAEEHRDLGERYLHSGNTELAIKELRVALELHERDPQGHFAIGEAYRRKQQWELAETHLRRALKLDPTLLDARLNLGVIFLEQGRWDDAVRETLPLADDPTFLNPSRALVNLGWAHYNSGRLDEAESYYRKALTQSRSHFQIHLNLGIVLYDQGKVFEAAAQFEKALELLEGRPPEIYASAVSQTRFRMAMAQMRMGQRERAIENLEAAAETGGETEWGQKSREYLAVLQ
jgi:type IV pilus assembly protein PilF